MSGRDDGRRGRAVCRHRRQRLLPHRADPPHRRRHRRRSAGVDPGDDRPAPRPPRSRRRAGPQPGRRRRAGRHVARARRRPAGSTAIELLDATDAAVAAGLLVEDGAGRLAMPHALIGQAIRARIGRTRRLDLHRRVAAAIEQASEPAVVPVDARPPPARGRIAGRARRADRAPGWRPDGARSTSAPTRTPRRGSSASTRSSPTRSTTVTGPSWRCCAATRRAAQGDRAAAVAAAREAARVGPGDGRPDAPGPSRRGLDDVAVGRRLRHRPARRPRARRPDGAGDRRAARRTSKRYQVRMRSMLTSVLVATTDSTRRDAAGRRGAGDRRGRRRGRADRLRPAGPAPGAVAASTTSTSAPPPCSIAVAEARRSGNVHLELTAMLFAMTDLLELGRIDEHRALLDEFRARAADAAHAAVRGLRPLHRGQPPPGRRRVRRGPAARRPGAWRRGEPPTASTPRSSTPASSSGMAQDLDQRVALLDESERMVRRQPADADVADRPPRRASSTPAASTRPGPLRGARRRRTACSLRDNQMFLISAVHARRGRRRARRHGAGRRPAAGRSSPTPTASR